jgi:hypothetical protein
MSDTTKLEIHLQYMQEKKGCVIPRRGGGLPDGSTATQDSYGNVRKQQVALPSVGHSSPFFAFFLLTGAPSFF